MQENRKQQFISLPDLIIFDLDGTLYDLVKLRRLLLRKLLISCITFRMRLLDFRIIAYFRKQRELRKSYSSDRLLEEQYDQCAKYLGIPPERVKRTIDTYMFNFPLQFLKLTKYKGVDSLFTRLRSKKIKIAIYSDYPVKDKLNALGLSADAAFCSTDASIGQMKPSSKALRFICADMCCNPENTVFIGDRNDTDGEGARLAGIRFILLERKAAMSGQFFSALPKTIFPIDERKTACWVCGNSDFTFVKSSDASGDLSSTNFAITNFDYGKTGELQKCTTCGFIQCTDLEEVVKFYEDLEDPEYETTRHERKSQEKRLVRFFSRYKRQGRLLDIGAGSGIMIEAAIEKGYDSIGIEPSKWLQKKAMELKLPVFQGLFPHTQIKGPFDVITLIDVLEHVREPGRLLGDIHKELRPDGIFVLVTPDVNSFAAKIFGHRWWHYRFAHLGYFTKITLTLLLEKTGFDIIKFSRPSWYFTLKYLGVRFLSFFPKFMQFPLPVFLEKITVPVNLRDSILAVCKKKSET